MQSVNIHHCKNNILIHSLFEGYSVDSLLQQLVSSVTSLNLPPSSSITFVKQTLYQLTCLLPSTQHLSYQYGSPELDDQVILSTSVHSLYLFVYEPNELYRNEQGDPISLSIEHDKKVITLETKSTCLIHFVKQDLQLKQSDFADSVLQLYYGDIELKDPFPLHYYLHEIRSHNNNNNNNNNSNNNSNSNKENNNYRLSAKVDMKPRGYIREDVEYFLGLLENEKERKQLKMTTEATHLDIFPIYEIPAKFFWVLLLEDYSSTDDRNNESLTDHQINTIKEYTGDRYQRINFFLSTLATPPKNDLQFIKDLILACCDSYQKDLPSTVYRMMNLSENELNYYANNVGKIICIPSFFSTSNLILSCFGCVKIIIFLPEGERRGALNLKQYSYIKEEEEILLSAFSFYEVLSVNLEEKVIHMKYRDCIHHHRKY